MELHDAFPRRFQFFHFGSVEQGRAGLDFARAEEEALLFVAFRMSGDDEGLCAVAFANEPALTEEDQSMAVEMANILVSKFATQLSDQNGELIRISPPELLNKENRKDLNLIRVLWNHFRQEENTREYLYADGQKKLRMKLLVMRQKEGLT